MTHGNKVIKTHLHKILVSRKHITSRKGKQANSTFDLSFYWTYKSKGRDQN